MRIYSLSNISWILLLGILALSSCRAQQPAIPKVYDKVAYDKDGKMYLDVNGERAYLIETKSDFNIDMVRSQPAGTEVGLAFDFGFKFAGKLHYGFIPYDDSKHPHPVYRGSAAITDGKADVDIKKYSGKYDMIGWEKKQKGVLGYRIVTASGKIIYDGIIGFKGTGPFEVDMTVIEGPSVNRLTHQSVVIAFQTNMETKAFVSILADCLSEELLFSEETAGLNHEILIPNLQPATTYTYTIHYGSNNQTYSFKTAAVPGSRKPFTFAYASDSRSGVGGGERDIHGSNSYIMKKIMALGQLRSIDFLQFSGDLINGYVHDPKDMELQYANWKRAIQPWAHYFPTYVSMGNHESLGRRFKHESFRYGMLLDRFPFATESGEAIFAKSFVLPNNGPESEDGAVYDPNPKQIDFPSYSENVFYYIHDNVAVIVLNSNYLYTPSTSKIPTYGGGMHAYIMDQQLAWLKKTITALESNPSIDHIFVTQHTPFFPNGGHVDDDMWCGGSNKNRPYIAGTPLAKGILERRDEMLDILVNQSEKTIAILTGDEHNYALTELSPKTNIYPEDSPIPRLGRKRTIYQVNNGAAGAPYYAQEQTPWTPSVSGFTTQHALVLFHINGSSVEMEVVNPDTLEPIQWKKLR